MKCTTLAILGFYGSVMILSGQDFASSLASNEPSKGLSLGASSVDFEIDGLFSSDIKVIDSSISFEQAIGSLTITGSYGITEHEVDVIPPPGSFILPSSRNEDTYAYSLGVSKSIRSDLLLSITGSYTDGFSDHRSLWISEFYENSFGTGDPQPESFSINVGIDWDYDPGRSSLGFTFGYSDARIVAGVAIDPITFIDLVVGDNNLDTFSGSVRWETALNPRIKTQQTLQVSITETRQHRVQFRSDWAFRLRDDLYLRGQIGGAIENPVFESIYGGLTLAYEITPNWQFDVGYRYYEDTGEINTANFNTAAPGVVNTEISAGLLWKNQNTSIRASVALYDSDFDPVGSGPNQVFTNLFRDRDFVAARFAVSHQF